MQRQWEGPFAAAARAKRWLPAMSCQGVVHAAHVPVAVCATSLARWHHPAALLLAHFLKCRVMLSAKRALTSASELSICASCCCSSGCRNLSYTASTPHVRGCHR